MNLERPSAREFQILINRREALKRTALMLGVALAPSTILAATDTDRSGLDLSRDWQPRYLPSDQAQVLDALTEIILPRSETPGAQDVGVAQFIDSIYGEFLRESEKQSLSYGLGEWAAQGFHRESMAEQTRMMVTLGRDGSGADKAFIAKARELTISGYFTSEQIIKNVLRYDPIPGSFRGCVPIAETGNVVLHPTKLKSFSTAPTGPIN